MSNIREDTAALITAIESIVSEIVARMTDRAASSQRLAFMSQNSPSPATIGTTTGNSDENTVASVTPQPSLALQRKSGQAAWDIVSQATKGPVRIIVEVKPATTPGYATLGTAHENMPAILSDNLAVEDAVITAHFGSPASSIESSKSLVHTDVLPYFGITATLPEIESLASDDRVVSIDL